jgi:hypothetical protein
MSHRNWRDGYALVAVGLLLAAILVVAALEIGARYSLDQRVKQPDSATTEQYQEQRGPAEGRWWPEFQARDTYAQWAMAVLALFGVAISIVGVIWIRQTLVATQETAEAARNSVGAAMAANDIAREIGKDQSRAYVHADSAVIFWGSTSKDASPYVQLEIINTGATPAKWFEYQSTAYAKAVASGEDIDPWDSLIDGPKRWGNLGGGGSLTFPINNQATTDAIQLGFANKSAFLVQGVIRYETFFGELFESEFSFFTHRVTAARFVPDGSPNMAGAGAPIIEKPQALSRSTKSLRSYERVKP